MPTDAPADPAADPIGVLEAMHDFGHHLIGLAGHHAVRMLPEALARPASAERNDLLERLRELIMPHEWDAAVARHAAPDGRP